MNTERGMNHFVRAIVLFFRSLKPSVIRNPRSDIVGTDHLGNKYFEIPPNPARGKRKPVRYFEPLNKDDWDVPLPPEWNAWLRMQREEPPSEEEQMRNLERMAFLKEKKVPLPETPLPPKDESSFPKFPEYEEKPGAKYKSEQ